MDMTKETEARIRQQLEKLCRYTATPGKGVTRLPFSEEAKATAEYLRGEMEAAGLKAWIDLVGNVHGYLPADQPDVQVILMGSHYDTVKNGGQYDGIAGVVCAISTAEILIKCGCRRKYALEIIAFNDEEGMMFGSGCLGSKSLTGQVDQHYIEHLTDENGISIREWMLRWGSDPTQLEKLKMDMHKVRAFFEIHIEQGPVLDESGEDIGIVTGIVGLLRCMANVDGRSDHAGTTPMDMRKDAILIASKAISELDRIAEAEKNGSVATCGFIRAYPNAMNVVAGKCEFTMDIRSPQDASIERMKKKIWQLLDRETEAVDAKWDVDIKLRQPAVTMSPELVSILSEKCEEHQYRYRQMVSGAAHDAMIFADKTDTVMVFVPSKDGRSHCPEEFSKCSDLAKAVQIVAETIETLNRD